MGSRLSNDDLGKIYGLYKQALFGDCIESAPWITSVVKYGKWKAWSGLKGLDKEKAKEQYIYFTRDIVARIDPCALDAKVKSLHEMINEKSSNESKDEEKRDEESSQLKELAKIQKQNRIRLKRIYSLVETHSSSNDVQIPSDATFNAAELLKSIESILQKFDARIASLGHRIENPQRSSWLSFSRMIKVMALFGPVVVGLLLLYLRYRRRKLTSKLY